MRLLTCLSVLLLLTACPAKDDKSTTGSPAKISPPTNNTVSIWYEPTIQAPLTAIVDKLKDQDLKVKLVPRTRGEILDTLDGTETVEPPDIYLFAGPDLFKALQEYQAIEPSSTRTIAGDLLALVQLKERGFRTPTLFDIYRLRYDNIGLMNTGTALGYFTEQALITEGVHQRLGEKIIEFQSFEQIPAALDADEIQLAIATTSQVAQTPEIELIMVIGEDLHEDIRYQAAASLKSAKRKPVQDVLRLLAEDDDIQSIFESYGCLNRAIAMEETK